MVLLQHKLNSNLKSVGFTKKKPTLVASAFSLTKAVAKENTWDSAAIEVRQRRLAKLAVKTWSIKPGA